MPASLSPTIGSVHRDPSRGGLLGKATADVRPDPFPYVVVPDALDADHYQGLAAGLPGLDRSARSTRLPTTGESISSPAAAGRSSRSTTCRTCGASSSGSTPPMSSCRTSSRSSPATSPRPCAAALPGDPRPGLEAVAVRAPGAGGGLRFARLRPLTWLGRTVWLNDYSRPQRLDVQGRATLALNTPVRQVTSVRGPHVDSPHKCYVGLFYLRHPADRSTGGDLELFRWKPGRVAKPWAAKIPADDVEVVETVRYEPNMFALFLNTSDSIHGVTVRSQTDVPRYLVVTSGWFASAPARAVGASNNGAGKGVYDD